MNLFLLPVLIASLGVVLAGRATAQTFKTLHSFNLSDGALPQGRLVLSGKTLYGTANGSSWGTGTVFAVNTKGTGFTILHAFTATSGSPPINSDGRTPAAELLLSGNTLYGTAHFGGSSGTGTVFAVKTDATGFTSLHSFTGTSGSPAINSDGAYPSAGLVLSGNTLYGTAAGGGSSGAGTVFAINTDGTGFTNLHSFTAAPDGAGPSAGLTLSGNTLYGTAQSGGSSGRGTVFAVNTDGTGFTVLHSFTGTSDGGGLHSELILSGNLLYGTTTGGGSSGSGTIFKVNTDGTGFTTLYSFTPAIFTAASDPFWATNSDGASPRALVLSGNTLYGAAGRGGSSGNGTVFSLNADGTGFTTLHTFTETAELLSPNSDGARPEAGLILSGNTLYGTTNYGGTSGWGTVFSLSLPPPPLTIVRSGAEVTLTWPVDAGFTLQSTTDLESPTAWSPVSPEPSVVNGRNAVSHPISGLRKFFRLSQ